MNGQNSAKFIKITDFLNRGQKRKQKERKKIGRQNITCKLDRAIEPCNHPINWYLYSIELSVESNLAFALVLHYYVL